MADNSVTHEHHRVAFALMMLGGIFDAYAYLLLDGSFASMQTGNAVFLVFSLAAGEFHNILRYILPLISFSVGILVSHYIKAKAPFLRKHGRYGTVLLLEGILLAVIGIWGEQMNHRVIAVIIAFLAAIQVSTFDRVRGTGYASTMITGNLRSAMESLYYFLFKGDRESGFKAKIYGLLIFFFALGVLAGAEGAKYLGLRSLLICLPILLGLYIFIVLARKDESGKEQSAG
jgi:uncharacterized membrane protein YoaK (UPF0700 family)